MSRKHFELIARVLRNLDGTVPHADRKATAEAFADELRATNPNFDRARFLTACGVK